MNTKNNLTFSYIKPDGFKYKDEILERLKADGFRIVGQVEHKFNLKDAKFFYGHKEGKSYYNDLLNHTMSGPTILLVLEKENAVEDFRTLIGDTNPALASENTIRDLYGSRDFGPANVIHGSDSDPRAKEEIKYFFPRFNLTA